METKTFETLKTLVESMVADNERFEKGNKAAGTRLRKSCQELKKVAQTFRLEIQEQKNANKQ